MRGFCLHKNLAGCGKTAQEWSRRGHSQKISIGRQTAAEFFKKQLTTPGCADIINHVVRHGTNIWGISSAGRALAWHARGHRFDPGILHQIRKASHIVWCLFCCCQTSEGLAHPGERRAWTARGSPRSESARYSPPKSTVLRRKYSAFLFIQTQKKAGASHKRESHRLC